MAPRCELVFLALPLPCSVIVQGFCLLPFWVLASSTNSIYINFLPTYLYVSLQSVCLRFYSRSVLRVFSKMQWANTTAILALVGFGPWVPQPFSCSPTLFDKSLPFKFCQRPYISSIDRYVFGMAIHRDWGYWYPFLGCIYILVSDIVWPAVWLHWISLPPIEACLTSF